MLPEFLDEQTNLKLTLERPSELSQLQAIKSWLASKETETNRQTRPAWMEVVWALITLMEQRLGETPLQPESLAFETHLIARQVAKQKGERNLPTRFVTDEIKRISNHQLDFLNANSNSTEKACVIGWYRFANRRALGFAILPIDNALELCMEAAGQENSTTENNVLRCGRFTTAFFLA